MTKSAADAIAEFLEEVDHVDKLHPENDQEMMFHRRYRIAYYRRPEGMLPCPGCQGSEPRSTPVYISEDRMKGHCKLYHPKAKIMCDHKNCTVMFVSVAEKEDHVKYCHTKKYGWWIV